MNSNGRIVSLDTSEIEIADTQVINLTRQGTYYLNSRGIQPVLCVLHLQFCIHLNTEIFCHVLNVYKCLQKCCSYAVF